MLAAGTCNLKGIIMNKKVLVLLTLVPILTGYLLNISILIPGLGTLLFYLIPCATLIFWFYLGNRYSRTNWNILQATVLGNCIGFISFLLYLWQFYFRNDENRSLFISGISQLFVSGISLFTAKFAQLFESQVNTITQTSYTTMQILGLLLMVIIFMIGYVFGKVKARGGNIVEVNSF